MSQNNATLSSLAAGEGPLGAKKLKQIQKWIDADWESHDIDRDAVRLIERLLETVTAEEAVSAGWVERAIAKAQTTAYGKPTKRKK